MQLKRITNREFFTQPAEALAEALIGKIICHQVSESEVIRFRLTETEAYPHTDTACHANKYKTGNAVITQNMIGGTLYVHYDNKEYPGSMFDVVSNEENLGEGVLIRGGFNIDNPNVNFDSAPILLGEALRIDQKTLNRIDLCDPEQKQVWIADDGFVTENKIITKKRVGLDDAKGVKDEDKARLLRFVLDKKEI